jgi:hypothetical protein
METTVPAPVEPVLLNKPRAASRALSRRQADAVGDAADRRWSRRLARGLSLAQAALFR